MTVLLLLLLLPRHKIFFLYDIDFWVKCELGIDIPFFPTFFMWLV